MGTHPAIGVPPFIKDPPQKKPLQRVFLDGHQILSLISTDDIPWSYLVTIGLLHDPTIIVFSWFF